MDPELVSPWESSAINEILKIVFVFFSSFGLVASALHADPSPAEASATTSSKKKKKPKTGVYNPNAYLKAKSKRSELAPPAGGATAPADVKSTAAYSVVCKPADQKPAVAPELEKPVSSGASAKSDVSAATTQMANQIVAEVKENCRPAKAGEKEKGGVEPDVSVEVADPGEKDQAKTTGEVPTLSGTVGIKATF